MPDLRVFPASIVRKPPSNPSLSETLYRPLAPTAARLCPACDGGIEECAIFFEAEGKRLECANAPAFTDTTDAYDRFMDWQDVAE